mmetsp:Transcript_1682/g.3597  ORF Transcript_1682/g.3597 Transcript_1682/m.3597 type:complete len:268 (-) Transcript_1682:972-1775(-)
MRQLINVESPGFLALTLRPKTEWSTLIAVLSMLAWLFTSTTLAGSAFFSAASSAAFFSASFFSDCNSNAGLTCLARSLILVNMAVSDFFGTLMLGAGLAASFLRDCVRAATLLETLGLVSFFSSSLTASDFSSTPFFAPVSVSTSDFVALNLFIQSIPPPPPSSEESSSESSSLEEDSSGGGNSDPNFEFILGCGLLAITLGACGTDADVCTGAGVGFAALTPLSMAANLAKTLAVAANDGLVLGSGAPAFAGSVALLTPDEGTDPP